MSPGTQVGVVEVQAVEAASASRRLGAGGPAATMSVSSAKKFSKPAGMMISIMRASPRAGVPHRVQLAPRLADIAARLEHRLVGAGPKPDGAGGHYGELVLPGVALACLFHATVRDTASKCTEVPVL
jgi:hypothetical protein